MIRSLAVVSVLSASAMAEGLASVPAASPVELESRHAVRLCGEVRLRSTPLGSAVFFMEIPRYADGLVTVGVVNSGMPMSSGDMELRALEARLRRYPGLRVSSCFLGNRLPRAVTYKAVLFNADRVSHRMAAPASRVALCGSARWNHGGKGYRGYLSLRVGSEQAKVKLSAAWDVKNSQRLRAERQLQELKVRLIRTQGLEERVCVHGPRLPSHHSSYWAFDVAELARP